MSVLHSGVTVIRGWKCVRICIFINCRNLKTGQLLRKMHVGYSYPASICHRAYSDSVCTQNSQFMLGLHWLGWGYKGLKLLERVELSALFQYTANNSRVNRLPGGINNPCWLPQLLACCRVLIKWERCILVHSKAAASHVWEAYVLLPRPGAW